VKDYTRIARKTTTVLFLSQCLSSAGFIAAFTVNALVGVDLTGRQAMAGVPGGVYVLGQACGALVWGLAMERYGRRPGIALGQVVGAVGSALAAVGVVHRSLGLFLFGLYLVGSARSAVDLARFAAAEVYVPEKRGRAISRVIWGSTAGAIFGPLLVGPMGRLAVAAALPDLSGAYVAGCGVLVAAAVLIFVGLRPDPRDVGRELAALHPASAPQSARSLGQILRLPGVRLAMTTMAFVQMAMVVPMSITSVHMKMHQHALGAVSLVISAHTLGMYAFSIFTGRIADTWGRSPAVILGTALMIVACTLAGPSVALIPLVIALFLLGLGWNFAFVAASAWLADQLSPTERAKTQGFNDLVMNLSSGISQVGSGLVFGVGGYAVMAMAAGVFALVPLCLAAWLQIRGRGVRPAV